MTRLAGLPLPVAAMGAGSLPVALSRTGSLLPVHGSTQTSRPIASGVPRWFVVSSASLCTPIFISLYIEAAYKKYVALNLLSNRERVS